MDRRDFFKSGINKIAKATVETLDKRAEARAQQWIRPPYSLPELEFLLACTRCEECITACPYDVIFPLPLKFGADTVGTPAMNLLNKGCHLCGEWPCVNSCTPEALSFPEIGNNDEIPLPILAKASINTKSCLPYNGPECGACASSCPVEGALNWDMTKPVINDEVCTGCALCVQSCITEPSSIKISTL